MLIDFFYTLREAKLPVSVKEYLVLLEALDKVIELVDRLSEAGIALHHLDIGGQRQQHALQMGHVADPDLIQRGFQQVVDRFMGRAKVRVMILGLMVKCICNNFG